MSEQFKGAAWGAILTLVAAFGIRGCDTKPEVVGTWPATLPINSSVLLIHSPDGKPLKIMLAGETVAHITRHCEVSIAAEPPPGPDPVIVVPPGPGPVQPDPKPVEPPVIPSKKVTQITYVYEKSLHSLPREVQSTISKLNIERKGEGFLATWFEQDVTDGTGQLPAYVSVAADAAKGQIPCLVVQAGDTVLRVVKNPKTEAEIREAVKP